jgi:hypothetical protein
MTAAGPTSRSFSGPVFITGMWRSGSSLLYALLNKHPQVALMYEADLALLRPVFWKPGAKDWAARWEFWNGALRRHGFDPAELSDTAFDFRQAFELVGREYAGRRGALIWGDKSPDLYDRLVPLAKIFPEARFIVVWRSPSATCSSMAAAAAKGASFFRKPGMALRGLLGCAVLRRQCDQLLAAGKPLCELDYEDLVRDPAATLQRVCEFLGISYSANLATLEGANRDAIHSGEHHKLLRGTRIIARNEPPVLEATLAAKIQRYVNWWQRLHGGKWPRFPASSEQSSVAPGRVEKLADQTLYYTLRRLDAFTRTVFSHAPLSWLRWYRSKKQRTLQLHKAP